MNQTLLILSVIVSVGETILTILLGEGKISAALANVLMSYLSQVVGAVIAISAELKSKDLPTIKAEKIAEIVLAVVAPTASSLPPYLATWIETINTSLQSLIGSLAGAMASERFVAMSVAEDKTLDVYVARAQTVKDLCQANLRAA